jgi:hypothetical protein
MNGLSSIAAAFVGVNARSNNASPHRLAGRERRAKQRQQSAGYGGRQ